MKRVWVLFLLCKLSVLVAQTSTDSNGSGNFNNTTTWTSPSNLTGTANILDGHTVTIPANYNQVYSNKITFSGTGKLVLEGSSSKWVPATSLNASPPAESLSVQTNWFANTVWVNEGFGAAHYTPWLDSNQGWSAGSTNNGTDYLQYDLKSPRWVQGIVTQGRANPGQWVTSAKVDVSTDNVNWATAASSLTLNTDQNTKVSNNFPNVLLARYVRVTPNANGVYGHASMRLGVLLRDDIFKSCQEIKTNFPNAVDGVYVIDPDGAGATAATNCYCDMSTDGGGWTLVLNYLHLGNTNPALVGKSTALPLLGSTILGVDEQGHATNWGHAIPAYLTKFPFTELRFYAKTFASHGRVIHFKTSHLNTINYFKTGTGSMLGIAGSFNVLTGHTAFLPGATTDYIVDQGNIAMPNFPMYKSGTYHWGIRGSGTRWEVDDYPNSAANSTFHQIWIR